MIDPETGQETCELTWHDGCKYRGTSIAGVFLLPTKVHFGGPFFLATKSARFS